MAVNWMKAADQNGIPTAFIINRQGKVAWIGHPMTLQTNVLDQILADKFDTAAYAAEYEKNQQAQEQQQSVSKKLEQALQDKDWDAADSAATELEKSIPENTRYLISAVRLQILIGRHDFAGAARLAESSSDAHLDNFNFQNEMAWSLATAKGMDQPGLALAEKIATRANTAGKGAVPQVLDTLARLQFMNGETNEAVATEQKAVAAAPDELKTYLQKFLTDYQQGKLPDLDQQ
jgi:hypothetical protein